MVRLDFDSGVRGSVDLGFRSARSLSGFSFLKVVLAACVLSMLTVNVVSLAVDTVDHTQIDQQSEAIRHFSFDLLEHFCHPDSDVGALIGVPDAPAASGELSVAEAMSAVGLFDEERAGLMDILKSAHVKGFRLEWSIAQRGIHTGGIAVRLDRLRVVPVFDPETSGEDFDVYRLYYVRE